MMKTILVTLLLFLVISEAKIAENENPCVLTFFNMKLEPYKYALKNSHQFELIMLLFLRVYNTMSQVSQIGLIGAKAEGKCCWKTYQKSFFRGFGQKVNPEVLIVFGQTTKLSSVRSLKKTKC